jgi:hypothetical protein
VASLREVESDLRRALLGGDDARARARVRGDGLESGARLAIYRHHVVTTLTAALQATFPVVCRLVDERFFAYAADRYIQAEPPSGPCLFEYGAGFPDFLAEFPPCRPLPYLADVARLEWAMQRALHAPDATPLPMRAIQGAGPEQAASLALRLDPSVSLLRSPYPIDRIWRANRPDAAEPAVVDLADEGTWLEVRRHGDAVIFRAIDPAVFAFRRALAAGAHLADATEEALAADPAFDLAAALVALFDEGLPVALGRTPSTPGDLPCPSQP